MRSAIRSNTAGLSCHAAQGQSCVRQHPGVLESRIHTCVQSRPHVGRPALRFPRSFRRIRFSSTRTGPQRTTHALFELSAGHPRQRSCCLRNVHTQMSCQQAQCQLSQACWQLTVLWAGSSGAHPPAGIAAACFRAPRRSVAQVTACVPVCMRAFTLPFCCRLCPYHERQGVEDQQQLLCCWER